MDEERDVVRSRHVKVVGSTPKAGFWVALLLFARPVSGLIVFLTFLQLHFGRTGAVRRELRGCFG